MNESNNTERYAGPQADLVAHRSIQQAEDADLKMRLQTEMSNLSTAVVMERFQKANTAWFRQSTLAEVAAQPGSVIPTPVQRKLAKMALDTSKVADIIGGVLGDRPDGVAVLQARSSGR